MEPKTKDGLRYALAVGALIPIAYFLLIMVLNQLSPGSLSGPGELLIMPLAWPVFLYGYLFPTPVDDLLGPGLLPFFLGANYILYSLLVYLGWRWRQRMPRLR
jgi:hypothetical protein